MTPEQKRILTSKPIEAARRFAELLHWRGLRLERILFTPEEVAKWITTGSNVPSSGIVTYYQTTDPRFWLQINEFTEQPPFTHQATIVAERYGIRPIGWHPFTLHEEIDSLEREAERLRPWLDRELYKDRQWLRQFKLDHPEMVLRSRKRLRGGP